MTKKQTIIIVIFGIVFTTSSFFAGKYISSLKKEGPENFVLESGHVEGKTYKKEFTPDPDAKIENPFNLLILGVDRRSPDQQVYNSDVIMLLTINAQTNKILFTSIPRDLWADSQKINGVYKVQGLDAIKARIGEITGFLPDKFVEIDFQAFVDAIDALGGIDIEVKETLIDPYYPLDRPGVGEKYHARFTKGLTRINGEEALIYARTRKTTSDFDRMRRQQDIIKALPKAFFSTENIFNPFVIEDFYKAVKTNFKTDLSISEVYLLFDMLKDYKDYKPEHIVLDTTNYLYHPPNDQYGGAYVLVPKVLGFSAVRQDVLSKISKESTSSAKATSSSYLDY